MIGNMGPQRGGTAAAWAPDTRSRIVKVPLEFQGSGPDPRIRLTLPAAAGVLPLGVIDFVTRLVVSYAPAISMGLVNLGK
jgi:hypothetical protein